MALTKALGGGGAATITVKDEGVTLSAAVTSLDFVGADVTATGTTAVTVTIPAQGSAFRCLLHNSGTISASTLGAFTPIPYDTEDADTNTMHSTVTNTGRITIVTAGTYLFTACWQSTGAMTGANIALSGLRLNGSTRLAESAIVPNGNGVTLSTSIIIDLSVGDYVEHCYYVTQAQTIATNSRFCAVKLA